MRATVKVIEVTRRASDASASGVVTTVTLSGGEVGLLVLDFAEDLGVDDFRLGEEMEVTVGCKRLNGETCHADGDAGGRGEVRG